jgi:shikimate dehydrogenase
MVDRVARLSEPVRVALVGRDILASRSPWLHEQEALAQGLALRYELVDFTARGLADGDLRSTLERLAASGYAGVNVTYPFKQAVLALPARLSPGAERIGAANTVRFDPAGWLGLNTDVTGFAAAVRTGLAGAPLDAVVQVGAGGGGSATAFALLDLGVQRLTLFDVEPRRTAALAARLASAFPQREVAVGTSLAAAVRAADGIVNATPVGMAKTPGTPVPAELLEARHWVADIVYFPLETELLRVAVERGCRVLDGSAMAVGQAADAFEIFTGRTADRARMLASFRLFKGAP